jgi:hypothetical protein
MAPRKATVCLLVAVLLLCPFACLPHAASDLGKSVARNCLRGDTCSCPASDRDEGPLDAPCSIPGGGTCLCHGAFVDHPAALPSPDDGIVSLLPLDGMPAAGECFFTEDGLLAERVACHFPSADSGREVRALIQSLLL